MNQTDAKMLSEAAKYLASVAEAVADSGATPTQEQRDNVRAAFLNCQRSGKFLRNAKKK